jgi:hypothetical protein
MAIVAAGDPMAEIRIEDALHEMFYTRSCCGSIGKALAGQKPSRHAPFPRSRDDCRPLVAVAAASTP